MKKILVASFLLFTAPALADQPIAVTLQNHKFSPAEIHVKANTPAVIALTLYGLPAILINSYTALREVDPDIAWHQIHEWRLNALAGMSRTRLVRHRLRLR